MLGFARKNHKRARFRPAPYSGRPVFGALETGHTPTTSDEATDGTRSHPPASHVEPVQPARTLARAGGVTRTGVLELSALRDNDFVSFRTANSSYEFVVTNAAERAGWLTGSKYSEPRRAKLIGAAEDAHNTAYGGVRTGAKAVFLLEDADSSTTRKLITSPVVSVSHYRFTSRSAA